MKKRICLLLALSLLCAGVALAENTIDTSTPSQDTTVIFEVPEPVTEYTVTIPSSVTFDEDMTTANMTVTIGADSTLAVGATLQVVLESSANSFQLKQGDNAITYAVKKDSQTVNAGDAVLSWKGGEAIPAATTLMMELTETTEGKPAGDYSDTLTFKLTLEGASTGA